MSTDGQWLNHVEMVYAPGDRDLAAEVLSLLGCEVRDDGSRFLCVAVQPGTSSRDDDFLCVSEMTAEQLELECALRRSIDDGVTGSPARAFRERMRAAPQFAAHFGIRFAAVEGLEARAQAIAAARTRGRGLRDRLQLAAVFYPGDPGSFGDHLVQVFVWTDVIGSGLLAMGQQIELQWRDTRGGGQDPVRRPGWLSSCVAGEGSNIAPG